MSETTMKRGSIDQTVVSQLVWIVRQTTASGADRAECDRLAVNLLRNHGYEVAGAEVDDGE